MKRLRLLSVPALFLALSAPLVSMAAGNGNQDDTRKTKKINRSYDVTSEDKLQINNQFGDVTVSTWDQPKITVDIEIGARATTDEKAQNILDGIDVKEEKGDHLIGFSTKINDRHDHDEGHHDDDGDSRTFYIDYVIHMPAGNPLNVHNDFGHTDIPDFKGPVNLTSKYGSLTAGNLANVGVIDVEFGKTTIGNINGGKIVLQYDGSSRIGKISGNVRISSEFCGKIQLNVGESVEQLSLTESYSSVRMVVNKNLSAQISIHTNFGEFHNEAGFAVYEKHEGDDTGPTFDRDYTATVGDGKAQIKVKSEFGSLRLTTVSDNDSDNEDNDHIRNRHRDRG